MTEIIFVNFLQTIEGLFGRPTQSIEFGLGTCVGADTSISTALSLPP
jgi:hypothetical protein